MPADTLVSWRLTAERLQERIYQLEAIARLNGETIRSMQEAARAEVRHFLPITEALGDSAVNLGARVALGRTGQRYCEMQLVRKDYRA